MDQNIGRDEPTGAQPPAEAGGADAGAWNQAPEQEVPRQPAAGESQGVAAEYAAWSADASYQQQSVQPAQPEDTQAYAAPEPRTMTYSDQPAPQQQPQQPQQPQQYQQYQQQPQQQYQQPPQYYDQGAYGQQSGYYDQGAYGQQPQYQQPQYQQPQYQQPQYYDPNAYGQQPGYYDQGAYGQQPQYYDPNAYGQQYAQQGYQQPGQPYAYAQPGQSPWAVAEPGGYDRSFLAVLAGWLLLTWGFVFGVVGVLVLWLNSVTDLIPDGVTLSPDVLDLAAKADEQIMATGGIAIIIGVIHLIAAVGIFGHRRWGRAFGIVLGLLGVLIGLGIITISAGFEAMDVGLDQAIKGEEGSIGASLLVVITYLIVLLGMLVGRRHFRLRGVEG